MLKRCAICDAPATFVSASFVRVHHFCDHHGKLFHLLWFLWDGRPTSDVLARIDFWLKMKRDSLTGYRPGAVSDRECHNELVVE